jgi:hypothetical protein
MLEICRRDWQRRRIFSDGEKPCQASSGLHAQYWSIDHLHSECACFADRLMWNYRSLQSQQQSRQQSNNVHISKSATAP